jgi:AcrR family transcriptional regulator
MDALYEIADLKFDRRGGYSRGQEMFERILRAALEILVENGSGKLNLRVLASRCGVKPGNIAHYFKTKDDILRELLNCIIASYEESMKRIAFDGDSNPAERLERMIDVLFNDMSTRRTSRAMPELWAMSNHDPLIRDRLANMYKREIDILALLVRDLNDSILEEDVELLSIYMSSCFEGMILFIGHDKPWRAKLDAMKRAAFLSIYRMIKEFSPGDLQKILPSQNLK